MGIRFRKSIKIALGVKINLNKNSVSTTAGMRGVHYTVNSKGRKTASAGIPDTGISYTKVSTTEQSAESSDDVYSASSDKSISPKEPRKKRERWYLTVLIILFILVGIGSLFSSEDKLDTITISADEGSIHDINSAIPVSVVTEPKDANLNNIELKSSGGELNLDDKKLSFITTKSGKYDIYVSSENIKSNTITVSVEDKASLASAQAQKRAEEAKKAEDARIASEAAAAEAAAQEATTQQPQEQMVWISAAGSKYHRSSSCGSMNPDTSHQKTLSEAQSSGYEACKKCY